MQNFHDNKLWQDSFVVLMDIHDVIDALSLDATGEEITEDLVKSAKDVAAKIADGLSRVDRRIGRDLIMESIGLVAITRTQLAVAWGRGVLNDDTFRAIDNKYAALSHSLQQYR